MTNTRARKGGERGIDGKWYEGGQYLPKADETVATNANDLIDFFCFKVAQHIRINGLQMTDSQRTAFIREQVEGKTELARSWVAEADAAGI